ncbi:hypothetical protein RCL1_004909 [Eukaryota sp. TZLM3-RCL]
MLVRSKIQVTIAYGSQWGASKKVVDLLSKELNHHGFMTTTREANTISLETLGTLSTLIFVSSTVAQGTAPENAAQFLDNLSSTEIPLNNLSFAVIGLGSSKYPTFNVVAKAIHSKLSSLSATALLDPLLIDVKSEDPLSVTSSWLTPFLAKFDITPSPSLDLEDLGEVVKGHDIEPYSTIPIDLTEDVSGFVHSIESMSAVDGQGIRYMIFLQGCRYRCLFCCNPDTWQYGAGSRHTAGELIVKFKRALPFLKASKGGLTIGGGDPFTQPNFCAALCKLARETGVTAAIETTGDVADVKAWDIVLPHVDFVILCAKAFTADVFTRLTKGGSISTLYEFSHECARRGVPIWLTYVVLPGFTDSDEEVEGLCQFIQLPALKDTIVRVEILPYHILGKFKFEKMGLEYPLEGVERPTKESLDSIVERVRAVHSNVYL